MTSGESRGCFAARRANTAVSVSAPAGRPQQHLVFLHSLQQRRRYTVTLWRAGPRLFSHGNRCIWCVNNCLHVAGAHFFPFDYFHFFTTYLTQLVSSHLTAQLRSINSSYTTRVTQPISRVHFTQFIAPAQCHTIPFTKLIPHN